MKLLIFTLHGSNFRQQISVYRR